MTYNIIPHNARQTWQSLEHPSSKPESSGSVFLINRINCFLLSEMSSMSSSKRFFEKTSTSEEHETNSSTRDLQTLFSPSSLARFSLEGEKIVASKNKSFGTGVQSSKHKIYKDLQTGAKNCALNMETSVTTILLASKKPYSSSNISITGWVQMGTNLNQNFLQ